MSIFTDTVTVYNRTGDTWARAGHLPALSGGRVCWWAQVDGTFSMPSETDTDQIWEISLAVSYDDKLTEE